MEAPYRVQSGWMIHLSLAVVRESPCPVDIEVIADIINIHYPPPTNESIFYFVLGGEGHLTPRIILSKQKISWIFSSISKYFSILI